MRSSREMGTLSVRLPEELKEKFAALAAINGRSNAAEFIVAIREHVARNDKAPAAPTAEAYENANTTSMENCHEKYSRNQ